MRKHNQDGAANVAFALAFTVFFLIVSLGFGIWAFGSRQDYKNNVDSKIASAVVVAKQQEDKVQLQKYNELEKQPLRTYSGPSAYGSLIVNYPKTWSAYVDETGKGDNLLDGFFAPSAVPSISDTNSVFALRVSVVNSPYSAVLNDLTDNQVSNDPNVVPIKVTPYSLPKVPKVVGVVANGTFADKNNKLVTMVILPLRSQTLEIWTEGTQHLGDFNNLVLPNLSFSP